MATKESVNDLVARLNDSLKLLLTGAKQHNMLKTKQCTKINTTKTSKYKRLV